MNTAITKDILRQLMQHSEYPCVSIYTPTDPVNIETRTLQGPLRLRNQLDDVVSMLDAAGLTQPEIDKLLQPASSVQKSSEVWKNRAQGVAIFLSPTLKQHYVVPLDVAEFANVSARFHITPLLPLTEEHGHFFVLALSQNRVRLLEATLYAVKELSLENIPASLTEALRFDEEQSQLQFHTISAGASGGEGTSQYHGQGVGVDNSKNQLLRYFQQIDKGLSSRLNAEKAPLILAAVDYLHPIYEEANHYQNLVTGRLTGNPDELSAEALHSEACEVVKPILRAERAHAIADYHDRSEHGLASRDLHEIVPGAFAGRIDILFVLANHHQWGAYDAAALNVTLDDAPTRTNEDLLDAAAAQTVLHGGTVFLMDGGDMPEQTSIAAIFRY